MEREELMRVLRDALPELRQAYGVRTLALFGSYARGEARKSSDVDLLVEFDRPPGLFRYIEMEQHLSDLLGIKVDLAMRTALKPAIGRRILSEAQPI